MSTAPAVAAEVDTRQVKVAYCKECGGWILAACFPKCESDAYSRREFGKCAVAGDTIKIHMLPDWNKLCEDTDMCQGHTKPLKAKRR